MKHFFKVFFIALLCFGLMIGTGTYTYLKLFDPNKIEDYTDPDGKLDPLDIEDPEKSEQKSKTPFDKAVEESKRINILLLGLEDTRTDTIMVVSFDRKTTETNIISIPRDTYFHRAGHDNLGAKKINAVYCDSGPVGVKAVVQNILNIPIHNYVSVDYDGVRGAVDVIGGVEVDVPFHMYYEDPYDDPPLVIDIPKGKQVLDGDKAIQYLRYRHNNDMTVGYPNGDLGRIKAQQEFIKSAIKKTLGFRLVTVAREVFPYVKTDFTLPDVLLLVSDALSFSTDNITMTILPGRGKYIDEISFYVHDPEQVHKFAYDLYNVETE